MNFLGRSLIDVSGVAVVCSPFFRRNNGSTETSVNSPVAGRPPPPPSPPSLPSPFPGPRRRTPALVAISLPLSFSLARGKRRSIEILAVLKINYGMSARAPAAARDGRRARLRGRDGGGYFPGNSSRGRLTRRSLRIGRTLLVSISLARSFALRWLPGTPSTSFASNFSNTRDTLRALVWRRCRVCALARCFDETPCISGGLEWRLSIVRPICTRVYYLSPPPALSFFLFPSFFPSLSLSSPSRTLRTDWPPLVTSKYNRILSIVLACTRANDNERLSTGTGDEDGGVLARNERQKGGRPR